MRSLFVAALLAIFVSGSAWAETPLVKSEQPVSFPTWRQFVLTSPSLKRDFMVRVIPPSAPAPAGQRTAAIYLLDGNLYSGMAADTARMMALEPGLYAPAYIIAIGYDTSNPMVVITNRQNDYLHVKAVEPGRTTAQGGGGAAFEAFLIDELKPFIESRLPVDPARSMLAGHSYGGLFTANVAARRPEAFAGYAIGSPSVWAAPDLPQRAEMQKGAGKPVFVGVGALEQDGRIDMVRDAGSLAASMRKAGFAVESRTYNQQSHAASPNAWMADSFRYLLARPKP
jgi:predicted alpha/beta superfamily hydrolase